MKQSKLFCTLPEEFVCTPDSMAIDKHGDLVLSCPNFAQDDMSGCIVKIDRNTREVKKWFDVPIHPETGVARNMGIAFDEQGALYICDNQGWAERPELIYKGRMLRVLADDEGNMLESDVVAYNMEHPNGVRIRDGYMYVTQSYMHPEKDPSGKLVSGVYRFALTDRNIEVKNTRADKNCIVSYLTHNPECQYGVDGIVFDEAGALYIGNFGDGEIFRITFNADGSVKENLPFAKDAAQLQTTDGMIFDDAGNLYVADFSANAIGKVYPDGRVERLAQSPDCDGLDGGLDQPGEPIFYQGKIIASCFDLVTGPDKVNTAHELPATLAEIEL